MLSFALPTIATNSPTELNDIGFLWANLAAMPLETPARRSGCRPEPTFRRPSKHIAEAEDFLAFIASTAGVDAQNAKVSPGGPYLIKGAKNAG